MQRVFAWVLRVAQDFILGYPQPSLSGLVPLLSPAMVCRSAAVLVYPGAR
jgi:hypothetical protein